MASYATKAMAALQRLAAFGLPSRTAFPEFVNLLGELAPFDTAAMLWLGPDLAPVDSYSNQDGPPHLLARYAERWFDADEARFYPRQTEMQTNPALRVMRVSDFTPNPGETEIYDEIYGQARHHWIAGLALNDGLKPIGNLGLGRPRGAGDFSDEEIRLLKLARPYVVQALSREAPVLDQPGADLEDETGFLVADLDGRILHASRGGLRLLQGAAGQPTDLKLMRDREQDWARPMLARLGARVSRNLAGAGGGPARLDAATAYGRFVVRAYALSGIGRGEAGAIGVQIERRLTAGVRMLRSPAFRSLSGREQDVAQALSRGLSYPQIADQLGLGSSTVVTHVRSLGQKLGCGGREEIVAKLCA